MKTFKEYLINTNIHKEKHYDISKRFIDPICQLEDGTILVDFEDFIHENNIENIDNETYQLFLDTIFDANYKYIDNPFTYADYQKQLYAFENIMHSYDSKKLYDEICEICNNIKDVKYVNERPITQFEIFFNTSEDLYNLLENEKFWSLLHLYNYYDKAINDFQHKKSIILEPYKPEDITNKIYDEFNGIIYHITSKDIYLKYIKNKSINPKYKRNSEFQKIFRDARIFFIASNNELKIQNQLKSISNLKKINNPIVLKVNLKEYRNKIRFRIDSSALGYDAYFTEEPIPDYVIECLDLETFKTMDKEQF